MTRLFATLAGLTVLLTAFGVRTALPSAAGRAADTQRSGRFPHRILAASEAKE